MQAIASNIFLYFQQSRIMSIYFYASAITALRMDSNFSNYAQKYLHVTVHILSLTPNTYVHYGYWWVFNAKQHKKATYNVY